MADGGRGGGKAGVGSGRSLGETAGARGWLAEGAASGGQLERQGLGGQSYHWMKRRVDSQGLTGSPQEVQFRAPAKKEQEQCHHL